MLAEITARNVARHPEFEKALRAPVATVYTRASTARCSAVIGAAGLPQCSCRPGIVGEARSSGRPLARVARAPICDDSAPGRLPEPSLSDRPICTTAPSRRSSPSRAADIGRHLRRAPSPKALINVFAYRLKLFSPISTRLPDGHSGRSDAGVAGRRECVQARQGVRDVDQCLQRGGNAEEGRGGVIRPDPRPRSGLSPRRSGGGANP